MMEKVIKLGFVLVVMGISYTSNAQESRGEQVDTSQEEVPTIVEVKPGHNVRKADSTEEPTIYMVVEDMPEFPGGEAAMVKYLADNIQYPKEARKKNISGRVLVQFVVDKKGNITEAKVLKGIGYGCDEEALRVIKAMPKWKPGKQRGKPVKVRYLLPIRFELT